MKALERLLRWFFFGLIVCGFIYVGVSRCQSAIAVNSDSTACTAANPCTITVYRAVCNLPGGPNGGLACPNYPDPAFVKLANTANSLATTATQTGTKWVYQDANGDGTRPNLIISQVYMYVETAVFNGDPTRTPSLPSQPLVLPFQTAAAAAPSFPLTGVCRIVK